MANATQIRLDAKAKLVCSVPNITAEAAQKASEILQENHDKNDIIFTDQGLHNHIVHHICTSFALGASPEILENNYKKNDSYQRPPPPLNGDLAQELHDPAVFIANMFKPKTYSDYLKFFTLEIQSKGYKAVVSQYVFAEDERADIMFNRLFAGYYHPFIHLGFGLEFKQPAIVAEALAQTAIHPTFLDDFFNETEEVAPYYAPDADHFVNIMDKIRADTKLSNAARWSDDHKVRDGILARAKEEMIRYAREWRVEARHPEQAIAEMVNACAYMTCAAQHPPKQINFDFYYMHALNSSIFLHTFFKQSWISSANKMKLFNWKGRLDLCLYASRRSPPLLLEEITNYTPKHEQSDWEAVIARALAFDDDGHTCKMIRALAHGESICDWYEEGNPNLPIKGKMWLQMANMVIDSVEETGAKWIRSAGFEEAWEESKDRQPVVASSSAGPSTVAHAGGRDDQTTKSNMDAERDDKAPADLSPLLYWRVPKGQDEEVSRYT